MNNKKNFSRIVIILETVVIIALSALLVFATGLTNKNANEVKLEETSPCGKYTAVVIFKGTTGTFGDAMYTVNLKDAETEYIVGSADVFVSDDGKAGRFDVQWSSTYFKITFDGDEQKANTIIFPFDQESEIEG